MLLSIIGFPSGKTVSYKIKTKGGVVDPDWTTTGVTEEVIDATAGTSLYWVDSGIVTPGFEGFVLWKTADAVPLTAAEIFNIQHVNAFQISEDSSAADNLEAQYDGTGYSNINAPAYQSQATAIKGKTDQLEFVTVESQSCVKSERVYKTFTVVANAGNNAGMFKTNLPSLSPAPGDEHYKKMICQFTSGDLSLNGACDRFVISYNGTTGFLTVDSPFPATPADGATGRLINS